MGNISEGFVRTVFWRRDGKGTTRNTYIRLHGEITTHTDARTFSPLDLYYTTEMVEILQMRLYWTMVKSFCGIANQISRKRYQRKSTTSELWTGNENWPNTVFNMMFGVLERV